MVLSNNISRGRGRGRGLLLGLSALLTVFSLGLQAHSQEIICREDGTQLEMNRCAFDDYQRADQKLNEVYKRLKSSLPPPQKEELTLKEREWIQRRDATCNAKGDEIAKGGSMRPLIFYGCLAEETQKRTRELSQWKGRNPPGPIK